MNENNNTPATPPSGGLSTPAKVGLGAALVALPLGAYQLYKHLDNASDANNRALEKSFSYDPALQKIEAGLVKYAELKSIQTGLQSPKAIAIDAKGELLVAGDHTVRRFSAGGGFADVATLTDTPYCLAGQADGSILVGMKDHVEVYGADGQKKASWPVFSAKSYLTSITIAGNEVYVGDAGQRVVHHCDASGKVINEIGKADPVKGFPGLHLPSEHLDVAVAGDGLVWVNNPGMHRMEAYSPQGQLERFWGMSGTTVPAFPGCCNPTDFVLLNDGSFITAEKGIVRIKHFLADGRFDCVVATEQLFSDNMKGVDLAASGSGQVMVLERGTKAVRIFAPVTPTAAPVAAVQTTPGGNR